MQPAPTHWGLTIYEWLTIAAILLGPILAVATQLWFQARKARRDSQLWVFNTLMGLRPQIVHVDFVKAFNMIDVVFYQNEDIRKGRREFLNVATSATGRDIKLLAETRASVLSDLRSPAFRKRLWDTAHEVESKLFGVGEIGKRTK